MYLEDHSTVFCTLAIGDEYRERVATQIQSVLKFTHHDIYVVTDSVGFFGNYYGPRVHYVQFDESLTDLPLKSKKETFNYNLKMIPIRWVLDNVRPTITVYMDADTFLFGWDRLFYRFFPMDTEGVWGRFRNALNAPDQHYLVVDKLKEMEIDASEITARLPIENVMIFKNGSRMPQFFNEWYRMAKLSYEKGANSFFEAVEMAIALHNSKMPHFHMDNTLPFVDNFRTLHHNKIHIPFVI